MFTEASVSLAIEGLIDFVGLQRIKKSVATWRNALTNATPFEKLHVQEESFYWWQGFHLYWERKKTGAPYSLETLLLAKDAIKVLEVGQLMPASIKAKYAGALGDANNAHPHFFELSMAHHFLGMGHKLKWFEDEGRGIPEYTVTTPTVEFEVECKHFTADAGRQVTRKEFSRLSGLIDKSLRKKRLMGKVHIALTQRLPKSAQELEGIVKMIGTAAPKGRVEITPWGCVDLDLCPANDETVDWQQCQKQMAAGMGPKGHAAMHAEALNNQPVNPLSVVLHSAIQDEYVRTMYETMKEASARQLSGSRPAVLCIHIPEIRDFASLRDKSGLQSMSAYFFSKACNSHVCAVSYSSDTKMAQSAAYIDFSTDALAYKNALCKYPAAMGFGYSIARRCPLHCCQLI